MAGCLSKFHISLRFALKSDSSVMCESCRDLMGCHKTCFTTVLLPVWSWYLSVRHQSFVHLFVLLLDISIFIQILVGYLSVLIRQMILAHCWLQEQYTVFAINTPQTILSALTSAFMSFQTSVTFFIPQNTKREESAKKKLRHLSFKRTQKQSYY